MRLAYSGILKFDCRVYLNRNLKFIFHLMFKQLITIALSKNSLLYPGFIYYYFIEIFISLQMNELL